MKVYISGGCKNGKSMLAQNLAKKLAGEAPLYYVATMIPHDNEDNARIAKHLEDRAGWGFETLEQGTCLLKCLENADVSGTFLLDSVTALVQNEMFQKDKVDLTAGAKVSEDLKEFCQKVSNVVMVSDYIFGDAERYDELTEEYRKALALADKTAKECDLVVEVLAGNYIVHKGELFL